MKRLSTIKVLMTADTVGGVWTYASGLASALAASGAEISLVTMGPRPRADQREMLPPAVRLIESDLALEWQDPEAEHIAHARGFLAAVERQVAPDIIHLNSYREASFDWNAPVILVAHSCVNSWGVACGDVAFLSEPRWRHYTSLVAKGLDRADRWVSPTSAFGDVVHDLYRPCSRPMVIRNGVSPPAALPSGKECTILAAGRMWDAAKNLSLMSEAASGLDWRASIAGPIASSAEKSSGDIELLGELSHGDLTARMQRAAIFASPARYEPFGLAVLEAAQAGCALVLSNIPSFRELWDGAALFVATDDARALRAALADLSLDLRGRTRLQRAAFARAKHYSMMRMAAAYSRLYRSLLPHASRTAPKAVGVWA
jgi:glycosyltransferase involved in cell wall biosynthesis